MFGAGLFGEAVDLDEGGDAGKAGSAGMAALRSDPVDMAGGGGGACLDAAVALLKGGLGDDLALGDGAEIARDVGLEGRLVALQGLAPVMGAPGGLAVDGDELVPPGPKIGDPGLQAGREQRRIG